MAKKILITGAASNIGKVLRAGSNKAGYSLRLSDIAPLGTAAIACILLSVPEKPIITAAGFPPIHFL